MSCVGRIGTGVVSISPGHMIVSIADGGGGNALVTTAAAHGLVESQNITITGASFGGYNGAYASTSGWSPNTATTFLLLGAYGGDNSTGGKWA